MFGRQRLLRFLQNFFILAIDKSTNMIYYANVMHEHLADFLLSALHIHFKSTLPVWGATTREGVKNWFV